MSGRTQDAPAGVKAAQAKPIQHPALAGMLEEHLRAAGLADCGPDPLRPRARRDTAPPVLTPLRNEIPRAPSRPSTPSVRLGLSGGNRGGAMAVATADYAASYNKLRARICAAS
jgi:hypothetical protein